MLSCAAWRISIHTSLPAVTPLEGQRQAPLAACGRLRRDRGPHRVRRHGAALVCTHQRAQAAASTGRLRRYWTGEALAPPAGPIDLDAQVRLMRHGLPLEGVALHDPLAAEAQVDLQEAVPLQGPHVLSATTLRDLPFARELARMRRELAALRDRSGLPTVDTLMRRASAAEKKVLRSGSNALRTLATPSRHLRRGRDAQQSTTTRPSNASPGSTPRSTSTAPGALRWMSGRSCGPRPTCPTPWQPSSS